MEKHLVICIGRQFGSGGREIGLGLAKKLGIRFYDKEILKKAAEESGIVEELFEKADEKPTNSFLYSLSITTITSPTTSCSCSRAIPSAIWLKRIRASSSAVVRIISCADARTCFQCSSTPLWSCASSVSPACAM